LSDAEKSGIVECATMKISSLGPSVLSPNGKPFVAQVTSLSSRNACIIPNAKDRNSYFIEEAYIFDLSPKDRREIRQIIYQHFEYIEEQWDEFQRRLQK